jgi:hypothetical protein
MQSEHQLASGAVPEIVPQSLLSHQHTSNVSNFPAVLCAADGRQPQGAALDSARQNLASTFVNAFVNAGYGQDKLVTVSTEGQSDSGWCILRLMYQEVSGTQDTCHSACIRVWR